MLLRFDPFRAFDRFPEGATGWRSSIMAMDAYRRGGELVVHLDVPGVAPDAIDLTVERNVLTVSARRGRQPGDGDQVLASERPQGSFTRQLVLGDGVDLDGVRADHRDGVLTITVPVAERARPRKVEVGAGRRHAVGAGAGP